MTVEEILSENLAALDARVRCVISNKSEALALERARAAAVPALALSHKAYPTREAFDDAVLEGNPALPAGQRRALARHRAAMRDKFAYAAALEAKQARGLASGLARLARRPAAIPHALAETFRAKTAALRQRLGPRLKPEGNRLRFLIGLPDAHFTNIRPLAAHRQSEAP